MTWNFRGKRARLGAAGATLICAACVARSGGVTIAPDSARPARVAPVDQTTTGAPAPVVRPVEIASVRLRLARADTALVRMAGRALMERSPDVVAIEVTTSAPLGNLARSASPQISLDGTPIADTWPVPPNRLVAFVTDRQRLRPGVAVTVAWLGDERRTRTRQPIVLTAAHLQGIQ